MHNREQHNIPSPFRKLLLTDWYDGPTAGIAIDASGDMYPFEMLDWDDAHSVRVFRLLIASGLNWSEVEPEFSDSEPDGWTAWVLPPSLPAGAEESLQRAERSARLIAIIATSNLLESIAVWRPVTSSMEGSSNQRWLEMLGLPRSRRDEA